jgi:hypothetical protein
MVVHRQGTQKVNFGMDSHLTHICTVVKRQDAVFEMSQCIVSTCPQKEKVLGVG